MIILGYKPLDEKSVNFIIDNYYKLNYDEISEKLNISKSRVFAQCSELRKQGILKEKKKRYTWNFEDEELLKEMVEKNLSIEDISKKLNKQPNQIISKIKRMRKENIIKNYKIFYEEDKSNFAHNVTTWTNEEKQKLLDNIKNMGLKKLSKILNIEKAGAELFSVLRLLGIYALFGFTVFAPRLRMSSKRASA